MTFTQLTGRLKNFLRGWLLVLGLMEGLVECGTVCIKSEVILIRVDYIASGTFRLKMLAGPFQHIIQKTRFNLSTFPTKGLFSNLAH